MGYYIALAAVVSLAVVLGWFLNDWWRELKENEEVTDDGENR
jgi:hypothetical protein